MKKRKISKTWERIERRLKNKVKEAKKYIDQTKEPAGRVDLDFTDSTYCFVGLKNKII